MVISVLALNPSASARQLTVTTPDPAHVNKELRTMQKILFGILALSTPFLRSTVSGNERSPISRPEKPNVVLILTDDLGWQDVHCYDIDEPSPMETPNIDRLASQGVMFWQAYSPAPVCAPSRAAILSGLHPARGGMTSVAGGFPPRPRNRNSPQISPFFLARMPMERFTLAEALKQSGYRTGHCGKWHISKNHYDYPQPYHHGFDSSVHDRGVQVPMKPDRLTGFATSNPEDPYRLDENGFPFDIPQQAALDFLQTNKEEPFFLYYATWLVHAPIVMRSEALLRKYEAKLGVTLKPEHATTWKTPGQTNPFYCAMVEQLDYYVGQVIHSLETTDDPRWPGHKLMENTYVFFTSDNGGMEGGKGEIYTDNNPLDRGKISLKEGGTRVPLVITGPNIPRAVQTDVMVNGLDLYPTILTLTNATAPEGKIFDGCDLSQLLKQNPSDSQLVRTQSGSVRDTMFWHFPHAENSSSIRRGEYKLFRHYQARPPESVESLYRLYIPNQSNPRGDIEESKDLSEDLPKKKAVLSAELSKLISEMGGREPHFNPQASEIPKSNQSPRIIGHAQEDNRAVVSYENKGTDIRHADLIYTPNEGREWLRAHGEIGPTEAVFSIPEGTTHYFFNLIDENNFLTVYPSLDDATLAKEDRSLVDTALSAGFPKPTHDKTFSLAGTYHTRLSATPSAHQLAICDFECTDLSDLQITGTGSSLTQEYFATGTQSLLMKECKENNKPWMPLVSIPLLSEEQGAPTGYQISFDAMLDEDRPGIFSFSIPGTNSNAGITNLATIEVAQDGIRVNTSLIAPTEPGTWTHFDLQFDLSQTSDRMIRILITTEHGDMWQRNVPAEDYLFDRATNIQIISLGDPNTKVYIDNVVVTSNIGTD